MLHANFVTSLMATYLDLSEPVNGPLHTYSPHFAARELLDKEAVNIRGIQRVMPTSFRHFLYKYVADKRYAVSDPRGLVKELRTDRWDALCEYLDNYDTLGIVERASATSTLVSLGFYEVVTKINDGISKEDIGKSDYYARLLSSYTTARYVLSLEGRMPDYDVSEFEHIALNTRRGSFVQLNACLHMIVQNARHKQTAEPLRYWNKRTLDDIQFAKDSLSEFHFNLLMSRYYRASSFYPFLNNDVKETVREMDLAEEYAKMMRPSCADERIIASENWLPLMQSRSKEARWIGDLELAHARLKRAMGIDSTDSLRWLELGESFLELGKFEEAADAYRTSILLGPPGGALSWFMLGQCYKLLEDYEEAISCNIHSVELDPLAVSAYEELIDLAELRGKSFISSWAKAALERVS